MLSFKDLFLVGFFLTIGLAGTPDLAAWGFLDFLTNQRFDVVSSMVKIRQAGFTETVSSIDKFIEHLASYQEARILPR